MNSVITEAVVVRLVDYGEADRVATLYTREAGKLTALARGARRSRRRFGGALELFSVGEAALRRGRGELWMLESFHAGRGFPGIALDVTRVAHAAYLCELARELCPDEARDERVFAVLLGTLSRVDGPGIGAAGLRAYELALLDAVGFAPALDRCVVCDGTPTDDPRQRFDPRHGGLLCSRCESRLGDGRLLPLPPAVRRALSDAQQAGSPGDDQLEARWAALAPDDAAAARDILQAVLAEHLHRPLRSIEFIAKINSADFHG